MIKEFTNLWFLGSLLLESHLNSDHPVAVNSGKWCVVAPVQKRYSGIAVAGWPLFWSLSTFVCKMYMCVCAEKKKEKLVKIKQFILRLITKFPKTEKAA